MYCGARQHRVSPYRCLHSPCGTRHSTCKYSDYGTFSSIFFLKLLWTRSTCHTQFLCMSLACFRYSSLLCTSHSVESRMRNISECPLRKKPVRRPSLLKDLYGAAIPTIPWSIGQVLLPDAAAPRPCLGSRLN